MRTKQPKTILLTLLLLALSVVAHSAQGATLYVGITNAPAGGTAVAVIALQDAADVESFSLKLTFASGTTLALPASGYFTRGTYYPSAMFGPAPQVDKNHIQATATATALYLNGFAPNGAAGDIGTVSFDVSSEAEVDDTQVLSLSGQYRLRSSGAIQTFPPVATTFTVTDAVSTYDVTPSVNGGNGTISPATVQTVNGGEAVQFTLTPAAGYAINTVTGTCGGSLNGNVFTTNGITADCTVIASFHVPVALHVTPAVNGTNGTITPDAMQTVDSGDTVQFTLTPASGYEVGTVTGTCGGNLNGNVFTTNPVTADCTVIASFRLPVYAVTPGVTGGNGTITPSSPQNITRGETTQFILTPASGYEINTVSGTCGGSLNGNVYTTNNIFYDCSVTASFRLLGSVLYTVTPHVAGGEGSITPDTPQSVVEGTGVLFTLSPDPGYSVRLPMGGSCPAGTLQPNGNGTFNYLTGSINSNCTLEVYYTQGSGFDWNIFLPAILHGAIGQ